MKKYDIYYKNGGRMEYVQMDKDMADRFRDDEDVKKVIEIK